MSFYNKLDELGISIHTVFVENKVIEVKIPIGFNASSVALIKNHKTYWKDVGCSPNRDETPLRHIIKKGLNIDTFKEVRSINEIDIDKYDSYVSMIEKKILERAEDINFLMVVRGLLKYELSEKREWKKDVINMFYGNGI